MNSIWAHSDYKTFLRERINESGKKSGLVSKLAVKAGCQQSYLSQVLTGKPHLTPDQADAVAEALMLPESQAEFFCLLVEKSRATQPRYRLKLEAKLAQLKRAEEDLGKRLERKSDLSLMNPSLYYSSWLWPALHIATAIPTTQTVDALVAQFHLPPETILSSLRELQKMGLVENIKDRWKHSGSAVHLPKDSPFTRMNHQNWRQKAMIPSLSGKAEDEIHFSGVYAVSKEDVGRLRELVFSFIEKFNQMSGPSRSEELVVLTCDCFGI